MLSIIDASLTWNNYSIEQICIITLRTCKISGSVCSIRSSW